MPAVICLAGPASPEKTQFLGHLAAEFSSRGLTLGLITNPPPAAAWSEFVPPAGALHLRWPADPDASPQAAPLATLDELLARHFHAVDLVLSELEGPGRVKVELVPAGGRPARLDDPGLKALVCPQPQNGPVPCFGPDQAGALAQHLIERALPPLAGSEAAPRAKLRILVDGQRLPANHFVQEIVSGGVRAMIGSLKGGDRAGRLEIHLY